MQLREFEAWTLKECLQQVRDQMGPEAVILETRKIRKGGLLGVGARDAVCIVAATGISVKSDMAGKGKEPVSAAHTANGVKNAAGTASAQRAAKNLVTETSGRRDARDFADNDITRQAVTAAANAKQAAAVMAARNAYSRAGGASTGRKSPNLPDLESGDTRSISRIAPSQPARNLHDHISVQSEDEAFSQLSTLKSQVSSKAETERFASLERAIREIRDSLSALHREHKEGQERTVSAVVSAVAPAISAVTNASHLAAPTEALSIPCPQLYRRLLDAGVHEQLARELMEELPDLNAWSEPAQLPLAMSALRDLIERRVSSSGPIDLTPGQLKAVALIGPTGVGKTTTIAKLAAHFSLVGHKRVALLTVDTYRIAAVEQLKTYSQIIDIPIEVAYTYSEVLPIVEQYADFDLLLIDTAGRSQKNIMQVGELKSLLEGVNCETHLVLSAPTKEQDMLEAVRRFSGARVDRLIFSKLDETSTYGTLLNVADQAGIPLSYLTTGQRVPEDIEVAEGAKLAGLLLDRDYS